MVFEYPRHDVSLTSSPKPPQPLVPWTFYSGGGGIVGEQHNGTREQNGSAAGWDEAPTRTQGSAPRPQSAPAVSAGGDRRGWTRRPPQEERRRTSRGSAIDGRDSRAEAAVRRMSHRGVVDGRHGRGEAVSAGGGRQGARGSGGGQPGGSRRFGGTVSHARPATGDAIQLRAAVLSYLSRGLVYRTVSSIFCKIHSHGVVLRVLCPFDRSVCVFLFISGSCLVVACVDWQPRALVVRPPKTKVRHFAASSACEAYLLARKITPTSSDECR